MFEWSHEVTRELIEQLDARLPDAAEVRGEVLKRWRRSSVYPQPPDSFPADTSETDNHSPDDT